MAAMTFQQARAIREKYAALQAKADYERLISKLLDRAEVEAAFDDLVIFVRQHLENLPNRIASSLVSKDYDQVVGILRAALADLIREMQKNAEKQLAQITEEGK